jgi:hypothetical protein
MFGVFLTQSDLFHIDAPPTPNLSELGVQNQTTRGQKDDKMKTKTRSILIVNNLVQIQIEISHSDFGNG